ncbi:MAG: TIGR03067 domain-containing protein [Gemmataceae bacterium]
MLRSALAVGSLLLAGAVPGHSRQPAAPDNLDGTWELVSVIEGGKLMSVDTVKQTSIKDARVTIRGNVMQFTSPNGASRVVAFVTDPKASPRTIDLAGTTAVGGKGIYQRDGDNLLICVPGADTDPRPTTFASPAGRGDVLMTFRKGAAPAAVPVLGPPQPAPPAPPGRPTRTPAPPSSAPGATRQTTASSA